jgi:hypothetical protein
METVSSSLSSVEAVEEASPEVASEETLSSESGVSSREEDPLSTEEEAGVLEKEAPPLEEAQAPRIRGSVNRLRKMRCFMACPYIIRAFGRTMAFIRLKLQRFVQNSGHISFSASAIGCSML